MLSGLAAAGTVGVIFGDRVLGRLKSTAAATRWALASDAALLIFVATGLLRRSPRLAPVRPLLTTLGALALTLFFAGFSVAVRTDDRYTHRTVSSATKQFGSAFLWGLMPFFAYGLVIALRDRIPFSFHGLTARTSDNGRSRAQRNAALPSFLIIGWPNSEDRTPRSQWDCDDGFDTFDLKLMTRCCVSVMKALLSPANRP
jgi:hypothetical protein